MTTCCILNKDSTQQNLAEEFAPGLENDLTPQLSIPVISSHASQHPPPDATIIPDHFETYIRSLSPGETPDLNELIVAKESYALCAIQPLVDHTLCIESILDPGCQIIAMSEEVCHELSLSYDPSIQLNMQSANRTVDQSLGLACNVPFFIGDLTLYMQVRIIQDPAYDILFGHPFDVLTSTLPPPTQSTWTPVDSTGFHWTSLDFTIYWTIFTNLDSTGLSNLSTLPPPMQSTWTPLDSTGLHWTSLYTGPYSQNWTPLDCQYKTGLHWTANHILTQNWIPLDSTGLPTLY